MLQFFAAFTPAPGLQRVAPGTSVPRPVLLSFALACSLFGCMSRTLPLPPPEVTRVTSPDTDGYVTVTGYALEGASVGVVNDRTQEGVVVTSDADTCESTCAWEARLRAEIGDPLRVWQFFETEGSKDLLVPKPR
jgi:hypothetical protein